MSASGLEVQTRPRETGARDSGASRPRPPKRTPGHFDPLMLAWIGLSLVFALLCAIPVRLEAQALLNAALLVVLFSLRKIRLHPAARIAFLLLASYVSMRYFFWRVFNTLGFHDVFSTAFALALFGAELYGLTVYALGIFVNVHPYDRKPEPLPEDTALWPSVDVMVPSYNEDAELLEVTLIAALQIDYPADKLHVHLLDDGGTVQKRNDEDPVKAAEAERRHRELKRMCAELGAHYHTRERNEHAKAGNVNSAFENTSADLVLILDADHVPARDILLNTAGLFVEDEKLFLVQTPHFFINPDPIERNLGTYNKMPSENEMFYGVIQKGLDFWGASFFCGSAALMRRSCLAEIGGISGITITEDAETALELHARGYRSAYISKPMIAGLQPETFTGFVVQRVRWAQGMVQIFLLKNPLLQKGLKLRQKLCYLNSSFFWFFCYARVMFLLAPVAHLVFGLRVYDANLPEFLAYALPHVVAAVIVSHKIFGAVRWTLVSELYELMQSFFSLKGIIKVVRNPRAPTFLVTPKGEQLDKDFISPLAKPFYWLLGVALLAMCAGVARLVFLPLERDAVYITMGWNCFNLLLLLGALGALHEKKQMRSTPRVPCDLPGELLVGDAALACRVSDLSVGGAGLVFAPDVAGEIPDRDQGFLRVRRPLDDTWTVIPVDLRFRARGDGGTLRMGVRFDPASGTEKGEIVALVHADSDSWMELMKSRNFDAGLARGAAFLMKRGLTHSIEHVRELLQQSWLRLRALARSLASAPRTRDAAEERGVEEAA